MNSRKESEVKILKLTKKIKELEAELLRVKTTDKANRKLLSYLKRRIKLLEKSRAKWRERCKCKRLEIKLLNAKIKRLGKAKWHHYTMFIVNLCIILRVKCNCSYESIVKVLNLLDKEFDLKLKKIPCANTVQNWVSKTGLYSLKNSLKEQVGNQVSMIMDESIRLGKEKLLLILICPFLKVGKKALNFLNVQVLYMKGAQSWKGPKIAKEIKEELLEKGIKVVNILSDEGGNLKNAAKQLSLPHLPDIGHGIATCLRQTFAKQADYIAFNKLIASYLSKGVNQDLSYLCPPKLRSKARFMNQSRVIDWAELLLINWGALNDKEKEFFAKLQEHEGMIETLNTCMMIARIVGQTLKKEGLSVKSLKKVNKKLEKYKTQVGLVKIFLTKVKGYLTMYEEFVNTHAPGSCIHVSSDIIESMFGIYKNKANNYALTGLTKLNLELPLYCIEEQQIKQLTLRALEGISMTRLGEWVDENSSDNQLIRRLNFLKKTS